MATRADSIRYVYENDFLRISDVPRSTRKNWAKKDLLDEPGDGRYREGDVMETRIVALLVRGLGSLDDVRRIRDAELGGIVNVLLPLGADDYLVGLIEPRLLRFTLARSEGELGTAMRQFEPGIAVPFLPDVADARAAFWRFAVTAEGSADRRRRSARPQTRRADRPA